MSYSQFLRAVARAQETKYVRGWFWQKSGRISLELRPDPPGKASEHRLYWGTPDMAMGVLIGQHPANRDGMSLWGLTRQGQDVV
jgi:hypothetical protein